MPPAQQAPQQGLPLRHWFALAVGSGAFSIAIGEFAAGGSIWITLGGPLSVMAIYIAIGWKLARTSESISQFADSVYYLGFLLTLSSLVVALIGLRDQKDVWSVVTLFGVKLVTTLVGLGVRVYLTNFRPSVEDSVEVAEEMLSRAAVNLRHRFDQLAVDLKAQTGAINLTLSSAAKEIDSTLSSVVRQIGTELAQTVTTSSSSLRDTIDQVKRETGTSVAALRVALDTATKGMMTSVGNGTRSLEGALTSAATGIAAASDGLVARLDGSVLPSDLFKKRLQPPIDALAAEIEAHMKHLAARGEVESGSLEIVRALAEAMTETRTQVIHLGDQSVQLEARVRELTAVFERAIAAGPSFQNLADEVKGHAANIKAIAGSTGDAYAILRKEIDVSRARLLELDKHSQRSLQLLADLEQRLQSAVRETAGAPELGAP